MMIIKISKPPIAAKNIGYGSLRFSYYDVNDLQCVNIPRIIIHHGTILFMISFSALSAVNVILLSRSLSSNVIFTPEINHYKISV